LRQPAREYDMEEKGKKKKMMKPVRVENAPAADG
jgi:hypothetical protein